jgi:hypothetical protein
VSPPSAHVCVWQRRVYASPLHLSWLRWGASRLESKVDDEQTLTLRVAALYGWDVQRLPFKAPAAAAAAAAASADRAVCSSDDGDSCLLHCALCGVSTPLWGSSSARTNLVESITPLEGVAPRPNEGREGRGAAKRRCACTSLPRCGIIRGLTVLRVTRAVSRRGGGHRMGHAQAPERRAVDFAVAVAVVAQEHLTVRRHAHALAVAGRW